MLPIIPKDTFIKYKVFHIFCILAILALYFCPHKYTTPTTKYHQASQTDGGTVVIDMYK